MKDFGLFPEHWTVEDVAPLLFREQHIFTSPFYFPTYFLGRIPALHIAFNYTDILRKAAELRQRGKIQKAEEKAKAAQDYLKETLIPFILQGGAQTLREAWERLGLPF